MSKNRNPDPLSVQVSFRVRVPRGVAVTKEVLNKAYLMWVDGDDLPPGIEIRGIFWRNPARKGALSDWRYSSGSDLRALKKHGAGVESSARGDHEEARSTLRGALREIQPF